MRQLYPWRIVILVFVVTALCGCGKPRPGVVSIRLLCWGSAKDMKVLEGSIDRFEQRYPNIHVEREYAPFEMYRDKLLTEVCGGKAPDVARSESSTLPLCAATGLFQPMDSYVESDPEVNLPDYFQPVLESCSKYKGHWYCLPNSFDLYVLFYNKTMFRKCGVPYPDRSWDWNKLLWAAKKLTKDVNGDGKIDQWGVEPNSWLWPLYVWQNGGEIFSKGGSKCLLDQPAACGGLEFMIDLQAKYHVAPPPGDTADISSDGLFCNGKLGMIVCGIYNAVQFNEKAEGFDWDVAPLPKGKGPYQWANGSGFSMVRGTKHPKEAWELVKYLTSPEGQLHWTLVLQDAPARHSVADSYAYLHQPGRPEHRVLITQDMKRTQALPMNAMCPEIMDEIITNELSLAFLGKEKTEEACKRAAWRSNQLLSSAQE